MIVEPVTTLRTEARREPVPAAETGTFSAELASLERPAPVADAKAAEEFRSFEAFVLRTVVETMLPKDESVFGGGTAGGIWRSMMAERLGEEIASAGGVGIAELLADESPVPAARPK